MTLEKETSIYQLGAIAGKFEDIEDFVATKNSIFHQPDAPSTSGRKVGDIWYDSDDGYSMYKFDGTTWVREQYGTNAISVGAVTAARLDAQDVYTNFLRVYFLSAAQAEIDSLSAITANLGSVNVGGVNNEDGVIQVLDAAGNPIGKWDNTGLTAQGVFKATNGTESCTIDSDANGAFVSAENAVTAIRMSANNDGSVGIYEVDPLPGGGESTLVLWERTGVGLYTPLGISVGFSGSGVLENAGIHLEDDGYITFYQPRDHALLVNTYNGTDYNLIRNHNNGNISVSASGVGLYLGYENTTNLDFLHGKAAMDANGNFTSLGSIVSSKTSGQAAVYASNGGTSNRIFIYADASNGQAGLYSYSADNTPRAILVRENNSSVINTYGDWVFTNVIPWKTDIKGRPMISDSADGNRVSLLTSGTSGRVGIQAQFGNTGTTYSIGYFSVAASDIRLKKNIEDSTIDALSLVNAIKVRKFDWKDGRHQRIGMIADELEELDKALTIGGGYTDDNEMSIKSVDTFYLVGYLVKAVQELSAEIDRLKGAA